MAIQILSVRGPHLLLNTVSLHNKYLLSLYNLIEDPCASLLISGCHMTHACRPGFAGFVGLASFNVTTDTRTTTVTVNVTPVSCAVDQCGLQRTRGSCNQGRCACATGSQMAAIFIRNPVNAKRPLDLVIPACRQFFFFPTGFFSLTGMAAKPGQTLDRMTFMLAKPGEAAECAGPDVALLPRSLEWLCSQADYGTRALKVVKQLSQVIVGCRMGCIFCLPF